jgi:hypothetical protein
MPLVMMKIMAISAPVNELNPPPLLVGATAPELDASEQRSSPPDSGSPWNISTTIALALLVVLWAVKLYTTWGAWGNLTVDSGHEMYTPLLLAEGKQLYRDVWFAYGPVAPYFTSYLYRLFGTNLNVLYWAGSLSALGSAVFLYLTGMRLSLWRIGWAAGAVVLMEAFQPSLFCFPLPYASAAVYGSFVGCVFLWASVCASFSKKWLWVFASGNAAAIALLVKPEFGFACYGALGALLVARAFLWRSRKLIFADMAAVFPGVLLCGAVIGWMVSIQGADFIVHENMLSWPTAYFMKAYGKKWLEASGFTVSASAFSGAFHRTMPVAAVILVCYVLLAWRRSDLRSWLSKFLILLALFVYLKNDYFVLSLKQSTIQLLSATFFPQDMVLYVTLAAVAAWCLLVWKAPSSRKFAIALLLAFSGLLAFRVLMKMRTGGYPIYYNGPVVLSFLLLLCSIIPRSNRSRQFVAVVESVLCLACLTSVWFHTRLNEREADKFVQLTTERGTVRVSEHMAESYNVAIRFMKEQSSLGKFVLSVPEDTSLYFLSGTHCPTRQCVFTPGALAPGKMVRDTIEQIEKKQVQYLLWSNRTFAEYGVPVFGRDYDRELGDYLASHFTRVGPLMPNPVKDDEWSAVIWKRNQGDWGQ